ncbi:MAG: hypothetical protein QOE88_709 [Verrucomicrobiota bacterium]|jgi:hypothetical protein|nr:hypothetical protein [Verrucomicrobiota bacterium]MEA3162891.1 hypothetical protein [Verrucomicrobiota bacterium]
MKPTFLLLIALAFTPPLMAAQKSAKHHTAKKESAPTSDTTNFSVNAGGSVKNYSIEIPTAIPPQAPAAATGKISQQAAVLAALGWAPAFYGSTNTAATSVDFLSSPTSYYLVHLTGNVGGSTQPLYAAVLDDGRIVRPIETQGPIKETKPAHKSKKAKK